MLEIIDLVIRTHAIKIFLQWIPSHVNIPGNEAADKLAKEGANQEQTDSPVTQDTSKQIIKENIRSEWLKDWEDNNTGRSLYAFLRAPNQKDPINALGRREQVIIYRLRTQHIQLNAHLNRINPEHPPMCPLCGCQFETVPHFLFECQNLQDLRQLYLPPDPDLEKILYSSTPQLERTVTYYNMANRRRANAQMTAGSTK